VNYNPESHKSIFIIIGIEYSFLLFIVDPDKIYADTCFTRKQCQVLTMALNISKRFGNQFDDFQQEDIQIQKEYTSIFSRLGSFRIEVFKNQRHFRMSGITGKLFLKLIWESLLSLQGIREGNDGSFYKQGNGMETLNYYLDVQPNVVPMTNDEIQETANYIVRNCFIVAQSIGIKNAWDCKPSMILDLSNMEEVESFCQRGSRIISNFIEDEIIENEIPEYINEDDFMKDCPLILSADIAVTFSPLQENESLVVNGYTANKILFDLKKQKYNKVASYYMDQNLDTARGESNNEINIISQKSK